MGERFPVVQGIYIDNELMTLPRVLAAGVKPESSVSNDDLALIAKYGGEACCYNAVPAMLVAAHACRKILAILIPAAVSAPQSLLDDIHYALDQIQRSTSGGK